MPFALRVRDPRRDPWKPRHNKPDQTIPEARLMRVVVVEKSPEDARFDVYSIVFKSPDGQQFAINAAGDEIGLLVQACCQAQRL